MDKKLKQRIKRELRSLWLVSPERSAAISHAKEKVEVGYWNNGNKKFKVMYRCTCSRLLLKGEYQIDHHVPVEPTTDWNEYMTKLFCSVDNLNLLCLECHAKKTNQEKLNVKC